MDFERRVNVSGTQIPYRNLGRLHGFFEERRERAPQSVAGSKFHGLRSSFRDWAAECSDAPREVCELALVHVNCDRVEAPRTGAAVCSNAAVSSFRRHGPTKLKRTSERVVGHEVPTNFYRSRIRGPPPASSRRPVTMGPAFSVLSPTSRAGPTTRSSILFHASTIWTCQALGAEGLGPFVEREVGGDERGAPLVVLRDLLEQKLGAGLAQRHEAQLVDDQQLAGDHLLLEPQEAALVAGFHQLVHERGGRGEARREAPLAGGQPEPQGDMGVAKRAKLTPTNRAKTSS